MEVRTKSPPAPAPAAAPAENGQSPIIQDASKSDEKPKGNLNNVGKVSTKDVEMRVKATISKSKKRRLAKAKAKANGTGTGAPKFAKLSAKTLQKVSRETRKIPVPPHRMSPLRNNWMQIYEPIVKHLKLQVRMNLRKKAVELKTSSETTEAGALQKGHDFVKAFVLGFSVPDAVALVRLDDLYIDSFEVKDIRSTLKGDHLSRAVGRIAGKDGRTKFTIENATKTRIVVADTKIHILGSYENTRLARNSISSLVLGTAPGKVYNKLRTVSARLNERKF